MTAQQTISNLLGVTGFISYINFYILLVVICEVLYQLRFKDKQLFSFRMTARNLMFTAIKPFSILSRLPFVLLYFVILKNTQDWHWGWSMKIWWHWIIVFIIADFTFYVYHLAAHYCNVVWAAHNIHHYSNEYNISLSGSDGIAEGFFRLIPVLPFAIIGIPAEMMFTSMFVAHAYMTWLHTQSIGYLGFFERIFVSPLQHKVHHARDLSVYGGTKNFGGVFVIWDYLFGNLAKEDKPNLKFGVAEAGPIYQPWKAQVFYFSHLIKTSVGLSFKDKLRLFFTNYNPNPIAEHKQSTKQYSFDFQSVLFCLLGLTISWSFLYSGLTMIEAFIIKKRIPDEKDIFLFAGGCVLSLIVVQHVSRILRGVRLSSVMAKINGAALFVLGIAFIYRLSTISFPLRVTVLALAASKIIYFIILPEFTEPIKRFCSRKIISKINSTFESAAAKVLK